MKEKKPKDDQYQGFVEAAKKLEADEDKKRFEEMLKKLTVNQPKQDNRKK